MREREREAGNAGEWSLRGSRLSRDAVARQESRRGVGWFGVAWHFWVRGVKANSYECTQQHARGLKRGVARDPSRFSFDR